MALGDVQRLYWVVSKRTVGLLSSATRAHRIQFSRLDKLSASSSREVEAIMAPSASFNLCRQEMENMRSKRGKMLRKAQDQRVSRAHTERWNSV